MNRAAVISQHGGLCVQRTRRGEYFVHQAPYSVGCGGTPVAVFRDLMPALEFIERTGPHWSLRPQRPDSPPPWLDTVRDAGMTANAVAARISGEMIRFRVTDAMTHAVEFDAWDDASHKLGISWAIQHYRATAPNWNSSLSVHANFRGRWFNVNGWDDAQNVRRAYG